MGGYSKAFPRNKQVLRRIQETFKPKEGEQFTVNRNPRNLEFLRIAHKNKGYELDQKFAKNAGFWHKLEVIPSDKYVKAQLVHFENGTVVQASTQEWCIKKHLYKTADTAAYINLARVFSQRCLMSGIIEMSMRPNLNGLKIEKFIEILKENGLSLEESPEIYVHKDSLQNRFVGKKMKPRDWNEILEHH